MIEKNDPGTMQNKSTVKCLWSTISTLFLKNEDTDRGMDITVGTRLHLILVAMSRSKSYPFAEPQSACGQRGTLD